MNLNTRNIVKGIYALLLGLLTGILTVMGQKYLPGSLNSLANSGAVWLIPAFFMASSVKKKLPAIMCCAETLIVCVISYYWVESILNQHTFAFGDFYFYLWLICAVIAGIIFGFGAYFYRQKRTHYHWGASLLPAVFLAIRLVACLKFHVIASYLRPHVINNFPICHPVTFHMPIN